MTHRNTRQGNFAFLLSYKGRQSDALLARRASHHHGVIEDDRSKYQRYSKQSRRNTVVQADYHQQLLQDGCAHILSPLQIQLQGERAVALGYSCVFRHHAGAYTAERIAANRWELCKQAGVWRVSRRLNALLDGGAAGQAALRFD